MRAPPEIDVALVFLQNEIMSGARQNRIVSRIVAKNILQKINILHLIPSVLRIKRTARRTLARLCEKIPFKQHILHRRRCVPDTAAALEDAVFDRTVDRIPERCQNERRLVGGRRAFLLD